MGVVLFPCKGPYDYPYVGFFQLPVDVSNIIHSICALLLFVFLSYNIGWIVMIAEALLLLFFGFAWLVKGQFVLKNL